MLDIYGLFKKIPGGSLLFPMFTVALINTIFPNLLASFGGMTTAMYKTGTLTIAGIILFATGVGINVKTLGTVLKRCGTLTIVKFAIAFIFGYFHGISFYDFNSIYGACFGSSINLIDAAKAGIASPFVTKWVVDKWGSLKVPAKKEREA